MEPGEKTGAGIISASHLHYADHLAVVCHLMNAPLLFTEEADYELAKRYYPDVDIRLVDYEEFSRDYLIRNYDVLFLSDLWDKKTFHEKYEELEERYQKVMRHVHCPHGFSDKGFYLKKCANEDIVLIYGQNMLDLLEHHGVLAKIDNYVLTGNYRLAYFQKHRQFYDELIANEVLNRFALKQPIILYAPTWLDGEESSTLFEAYSYILDHLPDNYNMIIKLHPQLEVDDTAMYYHIIGKYEKKSNVLFLREFPLIYPLLAHTDIYLGDVSSVGYDFLYFNKPMFFLNKRKRDSLNERSVYLFRCGVDIKPDGYPLLYQMIEANLLNSEERFGKVRSEVYRYTFGEERSFADIKRGIIEAYNKPLT